MMRQSRYKVIWKEHTDTEDVQNQECLDSLTNARNTFVLLQTYSECTDIQLIDIRHDRIMHETKRSK